MNEIDVKVTHQGIYCSPWDEVFLYDNQQPSRRSGLLYHMQSGCNLHTHSPIIEYNINNNDGIWTP